MSDKRGIVELARFLHDKGIEIISTGGTMKAIEDAGIPVTYVSDVTGTPEMMDGRVKTLNPKIHGGILAVRSNPKHMEDMKKNGIKPIDLVVCNLYPFEATIAKPNVAEAEAIENIDIGGPCMVRASAKNFHDVVVITNPDRYASLMKMLDEKGDVDLKTRRMLAHEAFAHTAHYDTAISAYFEKTAVIKEAYWYECTRHRRWRPRTYNCLETRPKSQGEEALCDSWRPGMMGLAECVPMDVTNLEGLAQWAETHAIDLTVVGPEAPFVAGLVDVFEAHGLKAFGPKAKAAEIEGSKIFSKELMEKYHVPYGIFSRYAIPWMKRRLTFAKKGRARLSSRPMDLLPVKVSLSR